jgi:hypothetical protein
MERFKEAARAGYYGGDHVCIIRVMRRPLTGKGKSDGGQGGSQDEPL